MAQLQKNRDPQTGKVYFYGIEGKLRVKTAILWDDVLTSGSTILKAIAYLKSQGIKKIILIITHPLWFKTKKTKMPEILKEVELVITTDSISVSGHISRKIIVLPLINFLLKILTRRES
ncbi:MAG: phosphoribosyltransferase family protein [Patescibacteria group bacterium]